MPPLITREINNAGQPLVDSAGNLIVGAKIEFCLVKGFIPTDSFDLISQEKVVSRRHTVYTNISGEFSLSLWPTDRGEGGRQYLCSIMGQPSFAANLNSGDLSPVKWFDFRAGGGELTTQELTAFQQHILQHTIILDKFAIVGGLLYYDGNPVIQSLPDNLATTEDITAAIDGILVEGGAVGSVNGQVGIVTLTAADVGAVSAEDFVDQLVLMQPALVSGTNIKTINGQSLLGSGDLAIGSSTVHTATGAQAFVVPACAVGISHIYVGLSNNAVSVQLSGDDRLLLQNGTLSAIGITLTSIAAAGVMLKLTGLNDNIWLVEIMRGTWA